jgi:hypothetical protein
MRPGEIVAALRRIGVRLHVVQDRVELDAADAPPPELLEAVKREKGGVLALLLGPKDLFERPKVRPGVVLERDERDHSPEARLLSKEARARGVTIPSDWNKPRRGNSGRQF